MTGSYAVAALLVVAIAGCGGVRRQQKEIPQAPVTRFDMLTLERSECGLCSVYKVTVYGDGRVEYRGFRFVEKSSARDILPEEQLDVLVAAVNDARYFSLRNSYRTERDGCPAVVTDHSSVFTSVTVGGSTKRIHHYLGCRERAAADGLGRSYPPRLTELEEKIDRVVNTARWVGTRK
jgi:hypothetical protein